jgi:ATP-dependent Clp protease ATP-binding subunit ClpA
MTPPPTLQELIDAVRQDAGTEDPIGQLLVASATASDLEQTTDALLGHFVDRCRRAGRSWSEISAALGVTKQAVHKRFAGPLAERIAATTDRPAFERFTQRARSVLKAADAAAAASASLVIGTEHLLLGLYAEPDGVGGRVLLAMQIGRAQVEAALRALDEPVGLAGRSDAIAGSRPDQPGMPAEQKAASGASGTGHRPMSPRGRNALVNAVAVALELGHNYIGTEHILLGLYRDPDSLASRVLADTGAERAEVEARVAELLRGYAKP